MNFESVAAGRDVVNSGKSDISEIVKKTENNNSDFNPDKRIEQKNKYQNDTESKYNPDKRIEINQDDKNDIVHEKNEIIHKLGGSYKEVKQYSDGESKEVHHMPADSASYLERDDGPAIKMDKDDHRQTASCGNSRESREYRAKQKELIDNGNFREALQMDIDDIHEKFGDKYNDAISEMLEYVDKIEQEGMLNV